MMHRICFSLMLYFFFGDTIVLQGLEWSDIVAKDKIFLYAGDIAGNHPAYITHVGLSLTQNNAKHICHDITYPMNLPDNCVDAYQAEDVFEHIEYGKLLFVIDEIYRVLKPGGLFRLSIPDYRCDVLLERSIKNEDGAISFDPGGFGKYVNGRVVEGGHVWFPTIEQATTLLEKTKFYTGGQINYLHYYNQQGISITKPINYSLGYVSRTPDHDQRVQNPYRVMSMVVDLYKNQ